MQKNYKKIILNKLDPLKKIETQFYQPKLSKPIIIRSLSHVIIFGGVLSELGKKCKKWKLFKLFQ